MAATTLPGKTKRPWGLIIASTLVLLFLHIPIWVIFLYTFTTDEATFTFPPPGLTTHWWWAALQRTDFWAALWSYFEIDSSTPYDCVLQQRVMPGAVWFPGARVNFAKQYAVVNEQQLTLTPTENRILNILYNHRGRVLSPGYLLAKAWDPIRKGSVESLWVHMRRLRSKIEPDPDRPRYVVTVRGQGYCLPQPNQKFEDDSSPLAEE